MFIDFPKISGVVLHGMEGIAIPTLYRVKQEFDKTHIEDVGAYTSAQMDAQRGDLRQFRGKRICITAGSRGIPQLDRVIKSICDKLKEWGASPFIIPAMGSHGGATAAGQTAVLEGYGITEARMGAPVLSSLAVVQYGQLSDGTPLYCDQYAFESDGIVVLNKVKPHTDFRAEHESGMVKMIMIGLAKHKGASTIHARGFAQFPQTLKESAEQFLCKAPVAFGIGIIQNAYDEISKIEVIPSTHIIARDKELLLEAKKQIAGLKFSDIDVMIVDEIGKNISGYGFDPNVLGRSNSRAYGFSDPVSIKRLFIRGLTEESYHNGSGICEADITTSRCLKDIDWGATWTNLITATEIQGGKIPMYADNDRDALLLAMRCCCGGDYGALRIARIKNTLCLNEVMVSKAILDEIKNRTDVIWNGEQVELVFDSDGYLIS